MPFIWIILGCGLGWWANVLFGSRSGFQQQRAEDEEAPTASAYFIMLAGVVLGWLARARTDHANKGPASAGVVATSSILEPPAPVEEKTAQPEWHGGHRLFYAVLAIIVLLLASEPYLGVLPAVFYRVESLMLSPRIMALLGGGAIGFWASRYRQGIAARSADFYAALIGTEAKSSWALQSLVAIIALLLIVLAIKPDMLENIESLKAGEVEAKFASVTAATREARISLNDLTKEVTLKQWIGFKNAYRTGSPRDAALQFDKSVIQKRRKAIRDILFEYYVEPLALLLVCLNEDDRIDRLRKREDFVRLAIDFRNKILKETKDGTGASFSAAEWTLLLGAVDEQIRKAMRIIADEIPKDVVKDKCQGVENIQIDENKMRQKTKERAAELGQEVRRAVDELKASRNEKLYRLSFLDPYFIGAVSDLIALTAGHTEKAAFLMQVKNSYPRELEFIQPGIINLYYYLSDSKLKSDAPWPLEEKNDELDFAMAGADYIISESRKKANAVRLNTAKTAKRVDATDYDGIIQVYFTNEFNFLARYLETFYQHFLSGDILSDQHRYRWARFYKQVESIFNLQELGPTLELSGFGDSSRRVSTEWKSIKVQPQIQFDAKVAMALSAVMLTETKNKASAQGCSVGHFYLHSANGMVVNIANNDAERSRLRAYLSQIEARIKASCPSRM
jgi:hypothetical protein